MAVLDSDYVQVEFSYESSWRALPDRKSNAVVWQATIIGGGRSLLRAKEYFERDLRKLLALHDEFGIESVDVQTGHPSMKTFPDPSQPDKKPTGYAFQQTITFKQRQVERFEDLLSNLARLESDYFHFDFNFESTRKR